MNLHGIGNPHPQNADSLFARDDRLVSAIHQSGTNCGEWFPQLGVDTEGVARRHHRSVPACVSSCLL